DVVNSLKASGRDVSGGPISTGHTQTEIRLSNAYTSLDAIRDVQILAPQLRSQTTPVSFSPGSSPLPVPPLTVADVATITDSRAERTEINRVNGVDGISIVVTKAYDANTVKVVDGINDTFVQLKPLLPPDLVRVVLSDNAVTVREALTDVNTSLILGAVLAM